MRRMCNDVCVYANDNSCDDGGPGSAYAECSLGADLRLRPRRRDPPAGATLRGLKARQRTRRRRPALCGNGRPGIRGGSRRKTTSKKVVASARGVLDDLRIAVPARRRGRRCATSAHPERCGTPTRTTLSTRSARTAGVADGLFKAASLLWRRRRTASSPCDACIPVNATSSWRTHGGRRDPTEPAAPLGAARVDGGGLERARRLAPRCGARGRVKRLEALAAEVAQRERGLAEKLLAATQRQKERVVEDGAARVVQRAVRGRAGGLWLLNTMTERRRRRRRLAEQRQRQVEDASALCLQRFARGAIARRRPPVSAADARIRVPPPAGGVAAAGRPPVALLPDAAILPGRKYVPLLPAAPTAGPLALYAFGALEYSLLVYLPRQDALALLRMRRRVRCRVAAAVGRRRRPRRRDRPRPGRTAPRIARARHLGRGAPLRAAGGGAFPRGRARGRASTPHCAPPTGSGCRAAGRARAAPAACRVDRAGGRAAAVVGESARLGAAAVVRQAFGVHWHRLPHDACRPGTFPPVAPRGRAPSHLPAAPPRARRREAFGGGVDGNEELRRTAPPPPPSALSPPRHDGLVFDPRASWRSAELYQGRAGLETLERASTRSRSVASSGAIEPSPFIHV